MNIYKLSAGEVKALLGDSSWVKEFLLNKEWRMSHLYFIQTRGGDKVMFVPNRAQSDFNSKKHTRNVICKSRQLGFTTYEAIDILDDCLFTRNFNSIMRAHFEQEAVDIFQNKINFAWSNLHEGLKVMWKVSTDKANQLKFDFSDGTISSIAVKSSGRSGTHQRIHISEFAKLCKIDPAKAEEVITGSFSSVSAFTGRIDIESTAEGDYGQFHEIFWEAMNRGEPEYPTEFKAHFYNWTWDDIEINKISDLDIERFKNSKDKDPFISIQEKNGLSDKAITYYFMQWLSLGRKWYRLRQEFPFTAEEAFISSGNKVFDADALRKQVISEGKKNGDWKIYEDFIPGRGYVLGADVAEGVGQDSSTCVILKTGVVPKVVAIYKDNKIAPDLFAHEIKRMAVNYGGCIVAPERNNHGHTTISKLLEIYPSVFYTDDGKREYEVRQKFNIPTMKYGFLTTKTSKPYIINALRDAVNNSEIEISSGELKTELSTYDKQDMGETRFNPDATKHWDLVMACFVKNTLILTNKGQVPIEKIKKGDLVMTRKGYKEVENISKRKSRVITNIGLTGTEDHPVFCNNNVTVPLTSIRRSDMLYIWNNKTEKIERAFFTEGSNTIDTLIQSIETTEHITEVEQSGKFNLFIYIEKFGKIISEKFLKTVSSTIRTVIQGIIKSKISKFFQGRNTHNYIREMSMLELETGKESIGIERKLEKQSENTEKCRNQQKCFVSSAKINSKHIHITQNTAQKNVFTPITTVRKENQKQRECVKYAEVNSSQAITKSIVPENVSKIEEKNYRMVYNLQVKDCPEYFANNILVHNCAIAYNIRGEAISSSKPLDLSPIYHHNESYT